MLPVFFDLEAKRAIVIGGTAAAAWKAELLAAAGAHVDIFTVTPGEEMLAGAALIVADAATRAEALEIRKAARSAGVPVNIIDRPEFCDFQFGAIVNRSPLVIGISTSGAAPVLAQEIRSRIECIVPPRLAAWVRVAAGLRDKVSQRFSSAHQRRSYWSGFVAKAMNMPDAAGGITIIRAETVEDLTIREVRALQSADVIHVGRGCPKGILDFARREARQITHADYVPEAEDRNVVVIQDTRTSSVTASMMARKPETDQAARPMNRPSISGCAMSARQLSGLTLPP